MELDVAAVRRAFPALEQEVAHFDGPGGSQVPHEVAEAVADAMVGPTPRWCRHGGRWPTSSARTSTGWCSAGR
jgi:hypothetical protein